MYPISNLSDTFYSSYHKAYKHTYRQLSKNFLPVHSEVSTDILEQNFLKTKCKVCEASQTFYEMCTKSEGIIYQWKLNGISLFYFWDVKVKVRCRPLDETLKNNLIFQVMFARPCIVPPLPLYNSEEGVL